MGGGWASCDKRTCFPKHFCGVTLSTNLEHRAQGSLCAFQGSIKIICMPGIVTYTYDLSTWKLESRESGVQGQSGLCEILLPLHPKKMTNKMGKSTCFHVRWSVFNPWNPHRKGENWFPQVVLWPIYTHRCVAYACPHTYSHRTK